MKSRRGFTLTELAATVMIAGIMMLALGVVLVDSQKGWQQTFERVFSDVSTDGYVAKIDEILEAKEKEVMEV